MLISCSAIPVATLCMNHESELTQESPQSLSSNYNVNFQLEKQVETESDPMKALISPDKNTIFTFTLPTDFSTEERKKSHWWLASKGLLLQGVSFPFPIQQAVISQNGIINISIGSDNAIYLGDLRVGKAPITMLKSSSEHQSETITSVAVSPNGKTALTGTVDGKITLWNLEIPKELYELNAHKGSISTLAFNPDGTTFVSGGDKTVRLWNSSTGMQLQLLENLQLPPRSAEFSPDGDTILFIIPKTAVLWNPQTKEQIPLVGHTRPILSTALSSDGKTALTGSADKTARLWDTKTGTLLQTFKKHTGLVNTVAFDPTNEIALTGSNDKTARLWNTKTGKLLKTLYHNAPVHHVAFSPDGKKLYTITKNGTFSIWSRTVSS